MAPLDAIFTDRASAIMVLAAVAVVLLAACAAALDFMSRTSRVLSPLALERWRLRLLMYVGVPAAIALLLSGGLLGAVVSGTPEPGRGTAVLHWTANFAFAVTVLACGLCSPLARHWGLGLAAFAVGLGLVFLLLRLISQLGFDDAGLLTQLSDRIVFGIAVGGIIFAIALAGSALVAMLAYVAERTWRLMRAQHHDDFATLGRGVIANLSRRDGR